MAAKFARAVIVGATTPLGKELAEQLNAATHMAWDLVLLDGDAAGQVTAAGDEALVVQPITADGFDGADIIFFATESSLTREHWKAAVGKGAGIVDLSGALTAEDGALLLTPLLYNSLDLAANVTTTAHPAAWMLARTLSGLPTNAAVTATVLLPASIHGAAAMDELHAQTVALLSFQSMPSEIFGGQSAFTLRDAFGEGAKANFAAQEQQVNLDLQRLGKALSIELQAVQAPVFHGVTASLFIDAPVGFDLDAWLKSLPSDEIQVLTGDEEVSNQSANGQSTILVRTKLATGSRKGVWLWLAADNLQAAARNALFNAEKLLQLRPSSTVQ
ncbi:segregation protein B [Granulicella cerasi]|uniref:Segregation protein B n=1 Tax=Granulicella cerasi TaxID=741063 RepID=A0ABW1Z6J5_9BACT|nr:segregation protein B [Granulicella cerasi]